MGRRQKDDTSERRTASLRTWVTPAERAEVERRAAVTGRHLSDYQRIVLLSDLKMPAPSARDPAAIRALALQLSKIGTNLNQLAHIANEKRQLPREQEFRAVAEQIIATLEKVMAL